MVGIGKEDWQHLKTDSSSARQTSSLGKSHKSNKAYNASTDPKEVFAGQNSCVLSPETTEGPFCQSSLVPITLWHSNSLANAATDVLGQDIRSNLTESQQGVRVHLDIQLIDVETCEPIEGAFIEMWSGWHSQPVPNPRLLTNVMQRCQLDRGLLWRPRRCQRHWHV
jgi:hypothetical protein